MMRIVFMGNPAFAIPTLKTILTSTHELAAVVSNPPKPMGRGQQLRHTAVGSYAVEHDLSVIPVEDTNSDSFITKLKALNPDNLLFESLIMRLTKSLTYIIDRFLSTP